MPDKTSAKTSENPAISQPQGSWAAMNGQNKLEP